MAALFSEKFTQFLQNLQPYGAPKGHLEFPAGLTWNDARIKGNEDCREMLLRCVNNAASGDMQRCQVEADLAVLAFVRWEDKNTLSSASIQVIKTEGIDIPTYLSRAANDTIRYFRFDTERRTGLIFSHPFPHVHCSVAEGPRYSLNGWQAGNVVIDFFEHVYLQCYHPVWLEWAKRAWNRHWQTTGRPADESPFERIVTAFRESAYPVLEELEADVEALKQVLRTAKDSEYRLRVDNVRRALLGYP